MLADLQKRRVFGGPQRVPLRVDHVQIVRLVPDLAAQDKVDVEAVVVALQSGPVEVRHLAHLVAHHAGGVIQRRRGGKPDTPVEVAPEQSDDALGQGQAAARQQHEDALAGQHECVHLAADVDLVVAGVRARVGHHHQPLAGQDS